MAIALALVTVMATGATAALAAPPTLDAVTDCPDCSTPAGTAAAEQLLLQSDGYTSSLAASTVAAQDTAGGDAWGATTATATSYANAGISSATSAASAGATTTTTSSTLWNGIADAAEDVGEVAIDAAPICGLACVAVTGALTAAVTVGPIVWHYLFGGGAQTTGTSRYGDGVYPNLQLTYAGVLTRACSAVVPGWPGVCEFAEVNSVYLGNGIVGMPPAYFNGGPPTGMPDYFQQENGPGTTCQGTGGACVYWVLADWTTAGGGMTVAPDTATGDGTHYDGPTVGAADPASLLANTNAAIAANPEIAAWLQAQIRPGSTSDPLNTGTEFPSTCTVGTVEGECATALAAAEYTNITTTQLTTLGADLTQPANAITAVNLTAGERYPLSTPITITYNPAVLPLTIPTPTPNELQSDYTSTLDTAGFSEVTTTTVSDTNEDPAHGPGEVINVTPAPGTRVTPTTQVAVQVNPADAPEPTTEGGAGSPIFTAPTLPGIHLPAVTTPCTVFPFGIPCWIVRQLGALTTTAATPHFTIGTPFGNLTVDLANCFGVDLGSIMAVVRPVLLFVSFLGIVFWLGGMALGGSVNSGGGTDDSGGESD